MIDFSSIPFAAAIEFFRKKENIPTQSWQDILGDATKKGFWTAGAMQADLLTDMRDAVDRAINEGISLSKFRKSFDETVARYGWDYNGSRNWRSQLIYETNMRTAYAKGRFEKQTSPDITALRPYLKYKHGNTKDPREKHLEWDGLILRADDPFWKDHYPPNGYGCECQVLSLSERDLKREGKTAPDKAPEIKYYNWTDIHGKTHKIPEGIDPGWNYAPGEFLPDLKKYPKKIKEQIEKSVPEVPKGFIPLKNTKEAMEFLKNNGIKKISGLKNATIEEINAIAEAIFNEHNISPLELDKLSFVKGQKKWGGRYWSYPRNEIQIALRSYDDFKPFDPAKEALKRAEHIERYKGYIKEYPKEAKKWQKYIDELEEEALTPDRPFVTTELAKDKFEALKIAVTHEIGHYRRPKTVFDFIEDVSPSEYGLTNESEYFSEMYAYYRLISKDINNPSMIKAIKEIGE